jgi:hypothetical protein
VAVVAVLLSLIPFGYLLVRVFGAGFESFVESRLVLNPNPISRINCCNTLNEVEDLYDLNSFIYNLSTFKTPAIVYDLPVILKTVILNSRSIGFNLVDLGFRYTFILESSSGIPLSFIKFKESLNTKRIVGITPSFDN